MADTAVVDSITQLITGIIHVTGEHDTGKTTFALENGAMPSRTCFFDDDIKGRTTVDELRKLQDFGAYHDLAALNEGKTEVDYYFAVMELFDAIKPGQFDTIILDTWSRFAKCLHSYIITHKNEFKQHWSPKGTIKGAEEWVESQWLEARILGQLQEKASLVVVVSHLKDYYANNAKVAGKQVPATSRTIARVPAFRIWLRQNPVSPVPIGLVLKRIATRKIVPGKGIRTVSVLPRKIVPRESDESLWDTIAYYFENPVGLRELRPDEIPDEYELSILNETLTKDQKRTLTLMLKAKAIDVEEDEEEVEDSEELDTLKAIADSLRAEGVKVTMPKLKANSGFEMSVVRKHWKDVKA